MRAHSLRQYLRISASVSAPDLIKASNFERFSFMSVMKSHSSLVPTFQSLSALTNLDW